MPMDASRAQLRHLALAACALALAGGCAPSARISAGQAVSSAGSSIALTIPTELSEAQTLSVALDRIDQRELPLDRTLGAT